MIVKCNPDENQKGCGVSSSISWSHPELRKALDQIFRIKDYEQIWQLEVTDETVTVRIKDS